ncbi:hypothetical protein D3C81_1965780 [compost metagenome]
MTHVELAENHNKTILLLQASDTEKINDCQIGHGYRNTRMMIEYREELCWASLSVDNQNMAIQAIQHKGIQEQEYKVLPHISLAHTS